MASSGVGYLTRQSVAFFRYSTRHVMPLIVGEATKIGNRWILLNSVWPHTFETQPSWRLNGAMCLLPMVELRQGKGGWVDEARVGAIAIPRKLARPGGQRLAAPTHTKQIARRCIRARGGDQIIPKPADYFTAGLCGHQ